MPVEKDLKDGERWVFDKTVAEEFDDMLERSIPQYEVMRRAVLDVGSAFVREATWIVDVGCSRGEALATFADRFGAGNQYLGVDVSEPMLNAARDRFQAWPEHYVRIENHDLRTWSPTVPASVVLAVLTIQFTPMEHRLRILDGLRRTLEPGGALIVVEKVLGATAQIDDLMVRLYYDRKRENGYTDDEIVRKAAALEGVLVPITAAFNEELLKSAGFRTVEPFWRWMNFCGWVATT